MKKSKNKKITKISKTPKSRVLVVLLILIFATVGSYLVFNSKAATTKPTAADQLFTEDMIVRIPASSAAGTYVRFQVRWDPNLGNGGSNGTNNATFVSFNGADLTNYCRIFPVTNQEQNITITTAKFRSLSEPYWTKYNHYMQYSTAFKFDAATTCGEPSGWAGASFAVGDGYPNYFTCFDAGGTCPATAGNSPGAGTGGGSGGNGTGSGSSSPSPSTGAGGSGSGTASSGTTTTTAKSPTNAPQPAPTPTQTTQNPNTEQPVVATATPNDSSNEAKSASESESIQGVQSQRRTNGFRWWYIPLVLWVGAAGAGLGAYWWRLKRL